MLDKKQQLKKYRSYIPEKLDKKEFEASVEFILNRSKWLKEGEYIITDLHEGNAYQINKILDNAIEVQGTGKYNEEIKIINDGEFPIYYKLSNRAKSN